MHPSIRIDSPLLKNEDAVKCMLILLNSYAGEFMSPNVHHLALAATRSVAAACGIPNSDKLMDEIEKIVFGVRRGTGAGALDDAGFW